MGSLQPFKSKWDTGREAGESPPVSAVLPAVQSKQVALNKTMSSFLPSSSPPSVEAAGAAAAGRTAAAVELAFPSPCLHLPFPTLDQVRVMVSFLYHGCFVKTESVSKMSFYCYF